MDGFSRYTIQRSGIILNSKGAPIKYFKSNKYLQCYMVDDEGKSHVFGVHTVIAREHCPDWFPRCVVHHKDGDYHNNDADNLECMTSSHHSLYHCDTQRLANHIKQNGPPNKGKKMGDEFCKKCSKSAKARGFNGNQFIDKDRNRRT